MINQIFQTAKSAIEKATQIVMDAYNLSKITEFKGKTDLVTKTAIENLRLKNVEL